MRPYRPSDRPALEAFLRSHVATSMFPLGNLFGGGLATESWVVDGPSGLAGYLGLAANGNLMPQWPGGDWYQCAAILAGRTIAGLVGPPQQCTDVMAALGLLQKPTIKSEIEPGYTLALDALILPDTTGLALRNVQQTDLDRVTDWRTQANLELLSVDLNQARLLAEGEVSRMVEKGSHWLLLRGDEPLALAGINAMIPGVVQIGGVFTPPALRRQGLARKVVALMLATLREQGVYSANLFAASDNAARAYLAIGFQPSHRFAIHLFATPEPITCP